MSRRKAPDTNLIVRLLVDDDPAQSLRARRFFAGGPLYFSATVLLETEWVLRASYRKSRPEIANALRQLLALPEATAEEEPQLLRALDWYGQGMDFADALHLARRPERVDFFSFDRRLVRRALALRLPAALPA